MVSKLSSSPIKDIETAIDTEMKLYNELGLSNNSKPKVEDYLDKRLLKGKK